MIQTRIGKHTYSVPTRWDELSATQLTRVAALLYGRPVEPYTLHLRLLQILCGMSWWRMWFCSPDELLERLPLVSFVLEGNTLTKQLMPKMGRFYGPADAFNNLLMGEFVFAENHYLAWRENESDTTHLDQLIAVLYRVGKRGYNHRVDPDGDHRAAFNENTYTRTARRTIARWPLIQKWAIAHWFDGCRRALIGDFPDVFKEGGGGYPAKYGLISLMRSVAQSGVHGDFDRVEKKFVRTIMMELDEMVHDAENLPKPKA